MEPVVHLRVVHLVSAKRTRAPLSQPMDGLLLLPHSESLHRLRQGFATQIILIDGFSLTATFVRDISAVSQGPTQMWLRVMYKPDP